MLRDSQPHTPHPPRKAEREGWLGEVEGLRVSLAGAEDKLGQINRRAQTAPTSLGMPTIRSTERE